jgi:hypothetical protein
MTAAAEETQPTGSLGLDDGEGEWLPLGRVTEALKRSDKTIRRYIKQGRFGPDGVQHVEGPYGTEYRLSREAVDRLKAELSTRQIVPLEPPTRPLERMIEVFGQERTQTVEAVQSVVQGAVQGLTDETAALREAVEAQGEQIARLCEELRQSRRPWYRRLFGL